MILVLNGSPNKNGFTKEAIEEFVTGEYIEIRAYELDTKPCDDCKYCTKKAGCKYKDMDEIYRLIEECDEIVIASPLYFGTLSSEMMRVITRFQTYFSQKYTRKEKMFKIDRSKLIVTAGGSYPNMFDGVKSVMRLLNMLFCISDYEEILIDNTDQLEKNAS